MTLEEKVIAMTAFKNHLFSAINWAQIADKNGYADTLLTIYELVSKETALLDDKKDRLERGLDEKER